MAQHTADVESTELSSAATIALFDKYVVPNYRRYPVALVRGEGSYIWDAEGRRYLDLFPGWGCNLLGHCPPRVVEAVREQVGRLIHVPNTWYWEAQGRLAEALSTRSFGGQCFFCNSGAEANEAAIKLARLHTPAGKYKIVTFSNGFHGRTLATVTATAQPKYHEGIEPLVAGFSYARYNDLDDARRAVDDETAAILVEPIQGEGGINVPERAFLAGLRELCDERGLLLMFDEVQCGMGRTGEWFGWQHFGVEPDVMTLAKGLAGGIAAGALVARKDVAPSLRPGMHASTFGGNPIACRAALATIETIEEENLLEHATEMGERFRDHLTRIQLESPLVREVRVLGMMIGVELAVPGAPVVQKCMERGVLLNCTHDTVIRLLPAMNITAAQVDEGCRVLEEVLKEVEG